MSDQQYTENPIKLTEYRSPGPVAQRCLNSNGFIRFIMGPMGSGKTTMVLFDAVKKAFEMPKAKDGNRYFSGVVIRDTYTNLWSTTIRSWQKFFPQTMGKWSGGVNRPAEHKLRLVDPRDGSEIHLSMRFTALADQSVEDALRGAEYTWAYMNEADRLSEEVLTYLVGRVGRYPDAMMMGVGTKFWHGIIGDVNPPDTDSWIYKRFVETKQQLHEWFQQPGGRDPKAENKPNLPEGYYDRMIAANATNEWWIKRMVDGLFGYSRDGEPVYKQYNDIVHCAEDPIPADPRLPLRLSFDQGITQPAMAVSQYDPALCQWRIINEYAPGRTSPSFFARGCKTLIQSQYAGIPVLNHGVCDPAGMSGEIKEEGHLSWAQTVGHELSLVIIPAETNELDPRIDVITQLLVYMPFPNVPAIQISPTCKILRKAFNSHYRYKRKQGLTATFSDKPEKNIEANVMEAVQYGALDVFGLTGVIGGGIRDGLQARDNAANDPYRQNDMGRKMPKPGDFDVFSM